jgi:hypothetical protein
MTTGHHLLVLKNERDEGIRKELNREEITSLFSHPYVT